MTIYFQGERFDQGRRRLGNGVLSFHRDWLELPGKVVYPTPPEVGVWFKRIAAHLFSGIVVKAGVHRYHACKGLIADPTSAECLPPFDFIPWNRDVLKPRGIRHRDTR